MSDHGPRSGGGPARHEVDETSHDDASGMPDDDASRPATDASRADVSDAEDDDASRKPDVRRPRSVYSVGAEPEVQSSLANQRTALSWVRTGLALIAGGVALTTVAGTAGMSVLLDGVAVVACLGGGALSLAALGSWAANERALRLDEPLPRPHALPWLVGGAVVVALVLAANAVIQLVRR